ncbi:LppU/SCO3897 family protein [Streptomyces sp. S6]
MTTPPPQGQNPFAQQPAPMGQTQPYGQYPGQGAPVPPPAPPKRNKKLVRVLSTVGLIVVAIVVKVGIGMVFSSDTEAEGTSVGACMYNKGDNKDNVDLVEVDCTSSQAKYKVVQKFDDTSDSSKCEAVKEATISYYQIGAGHNVVLCLKDV